MIKHLLFIGMLAAGIYYFWATRPVTHGPGVVAPSEPVHKKASPAETIQHKNHQIQPLVRVELEARVLSKKRYYNDQQSDIAPYDFVLGWGPMSDERNLDHILIKQSDRSYRWEMTKPPIDEEDMREHSTNVHLIPSSDSMLDLLFEIREGQVVQIQGYLVEIDSEAGWHLANTTKTMGDGSQVLWIEEISAK